VCSSDLTLKKALKQKQSTFWINYHNDLFEGILLNNIWLWKTITADKKEEAVDLLADLNREGKLTIEEIVLIIQDKEYVPSIDVNV